MSAPDLPAPTSERRLMSRPQPLGVLPTWWFWRDLRDERPLLGASIGALVGVFTAVISWVLVTAGVYLPLALVVAICAPMLGLGILERALRRAVRRRRRHLSRGALAQLPDDAHENAGIAHRGRKPEA